MPVALDSTLTAMHVGALPQAPFLGGLPVLAARSTGRQSLPAGGVGSPQLPGLFDSGTHGVLVAGSVYRARRLRRQQLRVALALMSLIAFSVVLAWLPSRET